jgi:hypothetical protein
VNQWDPPGKQRDKNVHTAAVIVTYIILACIVAMAIAATIWVINNIMGVVVSP